MKPAISLILNTYENPLALAKVLTALAAQTHPAREILVADDGSGEATAAVIREHSGRLPLQHCRQDHEGFRRAVILNKAVARTSGDYVVFLDGDSVPAREFVADHQNLAERGFWVQGRRCFVDESAVPGFEPRLPAVLRLAASRKLTGLAKAVRLPFPVIRRGRQQRGILGCNLGIWRDDLVEINGYDETFTGWGREDADLANRLYHLGRDRKFVYGRAIVHHLNHPVASRARLDDNQKLLEQTIAERRIKALRGLDQYLPHAAKEDATAPQ